MEPLERLLNLVGLLLETEHPMTFEEIRRTLPAYGGDNLDSAKRKFERDKDILREYGVPLEMAATDVWDVEQGYTIPKDRYYVPEIAFTPSTCSDPRSYSTLLTRPTHSFSRMPGRMLR